MTNLMLHLYERYGGTMKLNIDGIVEEIPLMRRNNLYYLEWIEGHITDPLRYMKTERFMHGMITQTANRK